MADFGNSFSSVTNAEQLKAYKLRHDSGTTFLRAECCKSLMTGHARSYDRKVCVVIREGGGLRCPATTSQCRNGARDWDRSKDPHAPIAGLPPYEGVGPVTYALLDLKGWRTAEGEQPWVTVEPPRLAGDLSMQDRMRTRRFSAWRSTSTSHEHASAP